LATLRRYIGLIIPGDAEAVLGRVRNILEHREVAGWVVLAAMLFFGSLALSVLESAMSIICRWPTTMRACRSPIGSTCRKSGRTMKHGATPISFRFASAPFNPEQAWEPAFPRTGGWRLPLSAINTSSAPRLHTSFALRLRMTRRIVAEVSAT
jgi:hypothetical protein